MSAATVMFLMFKLDLGEVLSLRKASCLKQLVTFFSDYFFGWVGGGLVNLTQKRQVILLLHLLRSNKAF